MRVMSQMTRSTDACHVTDDEVKMCVMSQMTRLKDACHVTDDEVKWT